MLSTIIINQGLGNDNYYVYVAIVVGLILLSPAIICTLVGFFIRKRKPKAAKILFIISGVYLLVGLGICGGLTTSF